MIIKLILEIELIIGYHDDGHFQVFFSIILMKPISCTIILHYPDRPECTVCFAISNYPREFPYSKSFGPKTQMFRTR